MDYDQNQPGQPQPAHSQPPPPVYSNPPPQQQMHPGAGGVVATGGTTVVIQQAAVKPSNYLALAIIVCIFCNIVLGEFRAHASLYDKSNTPFSVFSSMVLDSIPGFYRPTLPGFSHHTSYHRVHNFFWVLPRPKFERYRDPSLVWPPSRTFFHRVPTPRTFLLSSPEPLTLGPSPPCSPHPAG